MIMKKVEIILKMCSFSNIGKSQKKNLLNIYKLYHNSWNKPYHNSSNKPYHNLSNKLYHNSLKKCLHCGETFYTGQLPNSRNFSTKPLAFNEFSFENPKVKNYLKKLLSEYDDVKRSSKGSSYRASNLYPLVELNETVENLRKDVEDLESMFREADNDVEMKKLTFAEISTTKLKIKEAENELFDRMFESDFSQIMEIELEVSAGAGGLEAMLFCEEIFQMYVSFANHKGWNCVMTSSESTDEGGLRRASAAIQGEGCYDSLRFEGGVHRVQRIPATEKSGRIHTSTMSVAVMPQPREADIQISDSDLKIETKKASGAGGQHVNTTNSAVRITHIPSGIVTECQKERSQHRNKDFALQKLRSLLYQQHIDKEMEKYNKQRKLQVGNKTRSEKIRTYNYQQDRLTDHRIGLTQNNLASVLAGREALDNIIETVVVEAHKEQISILLDSISDLT